MDNRKRSTQETRREARPPAKTSLDSETQGQILDAISSLRYGTVEVTVHDARVVQINRTERFRMERPAS